ncbi:zinc-binding dehydrogenase [Nonomuraea sp. NPDC049400]|uniref:zinc-binding dehydrogenase n=1 Tax=Nonomuraea sp. NPDC049400 TaxID=3364352 RepID=UPI0037B12D8B
MRALVHNPDAPHGLCLGQAPDPVPRDDQVLVQVRAISFNLGELKNLAAHPPGHVSGWDAAGIVVKAAADGSGPPAGARVVTFGWTGGWAELRAVDTSELAVVPDSIDLGPASALPVAGVSALQALRGLGPVLGRRVLVTGASGGVGRYAVQLAARAGAHVIAAVGSPERGIGLTGLGAAEVVVGLDNVSEPVHGVIDNVGGPQLSDAVTLLADGGVIQWIGQASDQPTVLDARQRAGHRSWRLESFAVAAPFGPDLAVLVDLLAKGEIDPQVGWRGPWERASEAAHALLSRQVQGKVVLDVTEEHLVSCA